MVAKSYRAAVSSGATYRLTLLIERSKGNRNTWDGLNLIAQETLRRREPLPDDLAVWVADVLDGGQPRPKLRGSRRSSGQLASGSSKFLQHHLIVTAIDILATKGYRPTRRDYYTHGEACCPEGGSVFDAIGVAFGKPDRALGYKKVEALWTEYTKREKFYGLQPGTPRPAPRARRRRRRVAAAIETLLEEAPADPRTVIDIRLSTSSMPRGTRGLPHGAYSGPVDPGALLPGTPSRRE